MPLDTLKPGKRPAQSQDTPPQADRVEGRRGPDLATCGHILDRSAPLFGVLAARSTDPDDEVTVVDFAGRLKESRDLAVALAAHAADVEPEAMSLREAAPLRTVSAKLVAESWDVDEEVDVASLLSCIPAAQDLVAMHQGVGLDAPKGSVPAQVVEACAELASQVESYDFRLTPRVVVRELVGRVADSVAYAASELCPPGADPEERDALVRHLFRHFGVVMAKVYERHARHACHEMMRMDDVQRTAWIERYDPVTMVRRDYEVWAKHIVDMVRQSMDLLRTGRP